MSNKAKGELTTEAVRKAILYGSPRSMTHLAHQLGYKGSVSGTLTKKFRELVPDVDALLAAIRHAQGGRTDSCAVTTAKAMAAKPSAKPKAGKWPRHPQNPFREGSYATCFDILAAHPEGMLRVKLVETLAKAAGKDLTKASFDAQVVLSARGAAGEGLNPFQGPRNRSARFGYWVRRENSHVQIVLPPAKAAAAKGTP